jgi:hypothetical protein
LASSQEEKLIAGIIDEGLQTAFPHDTCDRFPGKPEMRYCHGGAWIDRVSVSQL